MNNNMNNNINNQNTTTPGFNNSEPQVFQQVPPQYNQQPNYNQNGQNVPDFQLPQQPTQPKKNKKKLIIGIVIGSVLAIALGIVVVVNFRYYPNYGVDNLSLHIPRSWEKSDENTYESKSGNCSIIGSKLKNDVTIENIKSVYSSAFTFKEKEINGYTWDYGYAKDINNDIHLYLISNDLGKYMILFQNNTSANDKECNEYIDVLEKSLTLKDKE